MDWFILITNVMLAFIQEVNRNIAVQYDLRVTIVKYLVSEYVVKYFTVITIAKEVIILNSFMAMI